ncbi:hypothetical protein ABZZ47_39415 [Streptomyces sp. NPDC006465]|uniref:hypothetical protein n=1 Tax=Streptomyces sp. NPDC006465 TaxID=3157174 RepID=UPI0033A973A1
MRKTAALIAMIIAAAALAACGDNTPTRATATVTRTVTATPATEPPAVTSPPNADPATKPSDGTLALTDTAIYENNVHVSLSGISRAVSSGTASPSNTPYVGFTLKVTNGSSKIMDLSLLSIRCQYGSVAKQGHEIFDSAQGLEGTPSTHLRAGRSITAKFGCELPRNEKYIQIEVQPSFESRTAIFAGNVQ